MSPARPLCSLPFPITWVSNKRTSPALTGTECLECDAEPKAPSRMRWLMACPQLPALPPALAASLPFTPHGVVGVFLPQKGSLAAPGPRFPLAPLPSQPFSPLCCHHGWTRLFVA